MDMYKLTEILKTMLANNKEQMLAEMKADRKHVQGLLLAMREDMQENQAKADAHQAKWKPTWSP
jgi:hypothetical protein